ncbi:MAG: SpoIIE family protein phosphatase [Chloroflexi bacterium]|nr:SpoIIE family protein phosphatase [Chloroflexota bacterium]
MKFNIRSKFLVGVLGISFVVYMALILIVEQVSLAARIEQIRNRAAMESASYVSEFNGFFKSIAEVPEGLALSLETLTVNSIVYRRQGEPPAVLSLETLTINKPEQLVTLLKREVNDNPEIYGSAIALKPYALGPDIKYYAPYYYRKDNKLNFINLDKKEYNYSEKEWFTLPRQLKRPVWVEPYFDRGGGNVVMCTYSVPFYHGDEFMGVVTADVNIAGLVRKVSGINKQTGGYTFIVSSSGRFVVHPEPEKVLSGTIFDYSKEIGDPQLNLIWERMRRGDSGFENITNPLNKEPAWIFFAPISSTNWSLAIVYPRDVMLRSVSQLRLVILSFGAFAILLLALIVLMVARSVTRPLSELAHVSQEIASGQLDKRVNIKDTGDEVSMLASSFNEMVDTLLSCKLDLDQTTVVKNRMEDELKDAAKIQQSILPDNMPDVPGFMIDAKSITARESGGDFFDFEYRHDNSFGILIGDTSGKGLPAALYMLQARTTVRSLSEASTAKKPSVILKELNHLLHDLLSRTELFITMIYGILRPENKEYTYASGGHTSPLFYKKSEKKAQFIESKGSILGLLDEEDAIECEDVTVKFEHGDVLMIYSDGLTDEFSSTKEIYGEDRLKEIFEKNAHRKPEAIVRAIVEDIDVFCNGKFYDDLTLVVIKAV